MKLDKIIPLEVYTDGSSKPAYGIPFGGWAYIITKDGAELKAGEGWATNATNQCMELQAAIEAVKVADEVREKGQQVKVYSDSAYLVNCYLQDWWKKWITNGWVNANKKDVANVDLWQQLIPYFENLAFTFIKVKGHDTNYWNNLCDQRAQSAADYARVSWRGKEETL